MARVGVNRVRGVAGLARVAALCTALAACASGRRGAQAGDQAAARAPTAVRVDNRNFLDMTIYVFTPSRVRLGLATGNTTSSFVIPADVVGQGGAMRFLADPVGQHGTPVSEEVIISPGDEVTLMIPPG